MLFAGDVLVHAAEVVAAGVVEAVGSAADGNVPVDGAAAEG